MSAPRPVLIHGSGGDHRVWAAQAARLGGAVALDLPGRPAGIPLTDAGALAQALLRTMAPVPRPRVLVGHSLGGAIAAEALLRAPDAAEGLVIVAGAARLPVPEEASERARDDFAAERERLVAGFVADPAGEGADAARAVLDACGADVLRADYAACRTVDLRGRLGAIRVPALVVAGSDDPFTPAHRSEALARELPLARLVVIPGARHLPMADADDTVTQLIAAFLARLEITASAS